MPIDEKQRKELQRREEEIKAGQIIKPDKRDQMFVLTNTSNRCKTATQGRRTELARPGGQILVSEKELESIRKASGEHDRAFQKVEKFDPSNGAHQDLLRRHRGR